MLIAYSLFIAPLCQFNIFKLQRLLVEYLRLVCTFIFPRSYVAEIFIITFSFSFFGLAFIAEMANSRFASVACLIYHQLAKFEDVRSAAGFLQDRQSIV